MINSFSHFVVTNPAPQSSSKNAIQTFRPTQYLVTDRGIEIIQPRWDSPLFSI